MAGPEPSSCRPVARATRLQVVACTMGHPVARPVSSPSSGTESQTP